ncbi:MAG: hypothetical protein IJQ67_01790 [Bacilli bacterium]|nr:hypothetical protein [Bacilli bacterium]
MEIINENNHRVLVASEGHVLQSVTDGFIVGPRLILGKEDSEIHYHEVPDSYLPAENSEE